jgi:hypothetical protein
MAEGRRMFQLFAARLFEQRVLTAFRQRIADERQKALLEELEEEKSNDVQREAKKQRDAQKRKEKKQQQKQAKAEEKARKEAEKKAEEDAAKALELQKQEEQRKKKEEQRKKKENERKAQEEERLRKEAEKSKRQQEERERQQESEKKAREQKAQEKKSRDEARRKQIEEKDAKEREAREKKAHAERQRKEREDKSKAEKEAHEKAKREAQAAQLSNQLAQTVRRTAPTVTPVAVPPLQRNPSGFSSPHVAVATPAVPKAPTPVRVRPGSQQGSKGSSPKTPQVQAGQGKSSSPLESSGQYQAALPAIRKTVIPKPTQGQPQVLETNIPISAMHGIPPPGMSGPPGFGLPPLNGFQHSQAPPMRNQQAMFPISPAQNAGQFRQQAPLSMPPGPPGMVAPGMPPIGRMFSDMPPGLQQPVPGLGATHPPPGFGAVGRDIPIPHGMTGHARQTSGSSSTFEHPIGTAPPHAVQRPAPIQRPSSVKPHEDPRFPGHDIDELSHQLGSSALLDDSDESFHNIVDSRRPPPPPGLPRAGSTISAFGPSPIFTQPTNQQRMDGFSALGSASNTASSWGTPPSSLPFGQGHISPAGNWNSPTGGWPAGNPATAPLAGLGLNPGLGSSSLGPLSRSRPVQLRTTVCAHFRQIPTDAYQDIVMITRAIERAVKPSPGVEEILDILDTEGNEHNGGGTFTLQVNHAHLEQSLVRWNPPADQKIVGAIGEIGSPNVMSSIPVGPPGLFPGLGAHHAAYH